MHPGKGGENTFIVNERRTNADLKGSWRKNSAGFYKRTKQNGGFRPASKKENIQGSKFQQSPSNIQVTARQVHPCGLYLISLWSDRLQKPCQGYIPLLDGLKLSESFLFEIRRVIRDNVTQKHNFELGVLNPAEQLEIRKALNCKTNFRQLYHPRHKVMILHLIKTEFQRVIIARKVVESVEPKKVVQTNEAQKINAKEESLYTERMKNAKQLNPKAIQFNLKREISLTFTDRSDLRFRQVDESDLDFDSDSDSDHEDLNGAWEMKQCEGRMCRGPSLDAIMPIIHAAYDIAQIFSSVIVKPTIRHLNVIRPCK